MACTDKCKPHNKTTASRYEYEGHNTWRLDYAEMGMPRYGIYFHVPCLSLRFTWFGDEDGIREPEFIGIIRHDSYGLAYAVLETLPERARMWSHKYYPGQVGSEPFDDLYRQHAILMVDRHGTGGHERNR